jgi:hypothetical protein
MVMRVLTVTPGKRASITVDATPGSSTLTVEAATDAGGPVPIALVVVMQATVDAPNMESLRDGSFLPPEMRAGATLTMHSRMAMGGQIELDEMRAGRFTACVVPLPATDPMSARALMEDADRLPMKCTPVTTGASPAKARVVVPVGWTTPKAP